MDCFKPIQVKGEGGEEHVPQRAFSSFDPEQWEPDEVKNAKDEKQQREHRRNACKANSIESFRRDRSQGTETPDRNQRDEESRHGEEGRDAVATLVENEVSQPLGKAFPNLETRGREENACMKKHDSQDCQAAKKVNRVETVNGGRSGSRWFSHRRAEHFAPVRCT